MAVHKSSSEGKLERSRQDAKREAKGKQRFWKQAYSLVSLPLFINFMSGAGVRYAGGGYWRGCRF